jgi:hypothetical protein
MRNAYKILVRKPEDLAVDKERILQEMGAEGVDLIHNMIQLGSC